MILVFWLMSPRLNPRGCPWRQIGSNFRRNGKRDAHLNLVIPCSSFILCVSFNCSEEEILVGNDMSSDDVRIQVSDPPGVRGGDKREEESIVSRSVKERLKLKPSNHFRKVIRGSRAFVSISDSLLQELVCSRRDSCILRNVRNQYLINDVENLNISIRSTSLVSSLFFQDLCIVNKVLSLTNRGMRLRSMRKKPRSLWVRISIWEGVRSSNLFGWRENCWELIFGDGGPYDMIWTDWTVIQLRSRHSIKGFVRWSEDCRSPLLKPDFSDGILLNIF